MEVVSDVLIEAGPENNPVPRSDLRFAENARKAIEASLPAGQKVSPMSHRYVIGKPLAFDWSGG